LYRPVGAQGAGINQFPVGESFLRAYPISRFSTR
jgi:hypothetical protein